MIILWQHTFSELTQGKKPLSNTPPPLETFSGTYPQLIVPIQGKPGYATGPSTGSRSMANQVLLELQPNGTWVAVGEYSGDTIYVIERLRGSGLADELLARCILHRDLPLTTDFTERGYGLLRRVQRDYVRRALDADLPVPIEVKAEFDAFKP